MNQRPYQSWFDRLMEKSIWLRWGIWLLILFSFLSNPNKKIGRCPVGDFDCVHPHYFYYNLFFVVASFLGLLYYEYKRKKDNDGWK